MIELDIKIKAKDQETVKLFTDMMMKGLSVANQLGEVNVTLTAEKDGDKITLIRKEIIVSPDKSKFTPIEEFISKSDLSVRSVNVLRGLVNRLGETSAPIIPFDYAEDISEKTFMQLSNAGRKSWEEVEAELKRQNIKY